MSTASFLSPSLSLPLSLCVYLYVHLNANLLLGNDLLTVSLWWVTVDRISPWEEEDWRREGKEMDNEREI